VADPDAHARRAEAAGAKILAPVKDTPWARGYLAQDPEQFLWSFSTYRPNRLGKDKAEDTRQKAEGTRPHAG
jgi:uncharacterized glyoxalase superfamily protein PhnB